MDEIQLAFISTSQHKVMFLNIFHERCPSTYFLQVNTLVADEILPLTTCSQSWENVLGLFHLHLGLFVSSSSSASTATMDMLFLGFYSIKRGLVIPHPWLNTRGDDTFGVLALKTSFESWVRPNATGKFRESNCNYYCHSLVQFPFYNKWPVILTS